MYGHAANIQLLAGPDDPDRDLAAVGNEDLLKHPYSSGRAPGSIRKSGSPYSTGLAFSARIFTTRPSVSDSISFISFMASTMQRTWPFFTYEPSSTYTS